MAKTNTAEKLPSSPNVAPKALKPTRTADELKAQFATYEKADQEVRVLEKSLEAAIAKRSEAVRVIGLGGAGPYNFKGRLLTVTSRVNDERFTALKEAGKTDDEAKEESKRYFFKSTGDQVVTNVG